MLFCVMRLMAFILLTFIGNPRIPTDIYLIHLNILPLKSSALPKPSTPEPIISSTTNLNINWPSLITPIIHYKTIDFLSICAQASNFLLIGLNLILNLNRLNLLCFHLYSICQGVSEAVKRVFFPVGIRVALKPHSMFSSVFPKPKDRIVDS